MSEPEPGDVMIRDSAQASPPAYVILEATTHATLQGPFTSLRDAMTAALRLSGGAAIWRENVDERGRALGPPILLPVRRRTVGSLE